MGMHRDVLSHKIRTMVQEINKVGLNEIRDYCDDHRPKMNFRRQLAIVRSVAQKGYTYASFDFGISRQAAEQALQRMYEIALQVEELENGKSLMR